jgi:pimeloyl-ACP methyl ester carboxylesterase
MSVLPSGPDLPTAAWVRQFVTVGDRQVHYQRCGSGPPVVFLPSCPRSSSELLGLGAAASTRVTAVVLDLPGYGCSDPLAVDTPGVGDYADAVGDALVALGLDHVGLYGRGSGASVALELARRRPDLARCVVADELAVPPGRGPHGPAGPAGPGAPPGREEPEDLMAWSVEVLRPSLDGSHLTRAWFHARQAALFETPFAPVECAVRRAAAAPSPDELHQAVLDRLVAGDAAEAANTAVRSWDAATAVGRVRCPSWILDDLAGPRAARLREVVGTTATELVHAPPGLEDRTGLVVGLLASDGPPAAPSPPVAARPVGLTRRIVATPWGQVLVREGGCGGVPVVLLHSSPISGASLVPVALELAADRRVVIVDTLGFGDSDKADPVRHEMFEAPTLTAYGRVAAAVIDALGIDTFDLYGNHSGAMVALEVAVLLEGRLRRMVLEGITLYEPAMVAELAEHYFVDITPRWDGAHLLTAWHSTRDATLWAPWYRRDPDHQLARVLATAAQLQPLVTDMLKAGADYTRAYRAVFEQPTAQLLARITVPTLVATSADDGLDRFTPVAAGLLPAGRSARLPFRTTAAPGGAGPSPAELSARIIREHLDGGA